MARLAADIRNRLKLEPIVEKGAVGQLDVYAGEELIGSQAGVSGLLKRITGPNNDELIEVIRARLAPSS